MSNSLRVDPVRSRSDLKAFVRLPWRIYEHDTLWVPPLISERIHYLDPAKGSFYGNADVALFAARRDGEILGTIAAFVDHARVRLVGRPEGGFGFFEVVEQYEVAQQLLDASRDWLRDQRMASVRGPTNFGDNESPGILIEGRDYAPVMLEAHTPPYYQQFLERYGMEKENDLFAWRATFEKVGDTLNGAPSDIVHVAQAAQQAGNLAIRPVRMREWDREVSIVRSLFNATIAQIPDGVPLSEAEFGRFAGQMRPFVDPELALIAEMDGKAVGYCVLIPDTNRVLSRLNGRLFPFNWLRIRRYIRDIDVVSFKLMGVLEGYRRRGIDALLYVQALRKAKERGYAWLDGSLTSELNPAVNLIARSRGAELYKHYRLYRMDL